MNKLIGVAWGSLPEEAKLDLLARASCVSGVDSNSAANGECIVDFLEDLSVSGTIVDGEIVIDDTNILYNPQDGIIDNPKEVSFEINNVMTLAEAAEIWDKTEGALRAAIKSNKLIKGVDYRKSGRITLISKDSIHRLYGSPKSIK